VKGYLGHRIVWNGLGEVIILIIVSKKVHVILIGLWAMSEAAGLLNDFVGVGASSFSLDNDLLLERLTNFSSWMSATIMLVLDQVIAW